jgi:hypothetical protein
MMRVTTRAGTLGLALVMLACSQQGGAVQPHLEAPTAIAASTAADDVLIVDQSRLGEIQERYNLSEPLGDIGAAAPCEPDGSSTGCEAAARQQLRETAATRGANLVVIVSSAMMQSFPPRVSLKGTLYRATPR